MSTNTNFSEKQKINEIPSFDESLFNSKLYIDLDSTFEQSLNDSKEEELENSEIAHVEDKIKEESFLIKELIKKLDSHGLSPVNKQNKSFNNNNTKLPLVNTGVKFVPKKYRNDDDNNSNDKYSHKKMKNSLNNNKKIKNKFDIITERKDDWECQFCYNTNPAIRKNCKECKTFRDIFF